MGRIYGTWKSAYYLSLIGMRLKRPEFKGDYWRAVDDRNNIVYRFNTIEELGSAAFSEMKRRNIKIPGR